MGVSYQTLDIKKKVTLPATQTTVGDSVPMSCFCTLEYIICYRIGTDRKTFKVLVNNDDTDVSHQIYAIEGAPLDIQPSPKVNGSNFEFEFINNEALDADLVFKRTII